MAKCIVCPTNHPVGQMPYLPITFPCTFIWALAKVSAIVAIGEYAQLMVPANIQAVIDSSIYHEQSNQVVMCFNFSA